MLSKKGIYIVFETLDNYSFDKTSYRVNNNTEYFVVKDVPYGNNYNELTNCEYQICRLSNLTQEESMKLPLYSGNIKNQTHLKTINSIYKDARERLLFTIYFPNATYNSNA